jgi:hypothetical protein
MLATPMGGYKTRPYGIELWLPGAIHIAVVAEFMPALRAGTRPAPTVLNHGYEVPYLLV